MAWGHLEIYSNHPIWEVHPSQALGMVVSGQAGALCPITLRCCLSPTPLRTGDGEALRDAAPPLQLWAKSPKENEELGIGHTKTSGQGPFEESVQKVELYGQASLGTVG